MGGGWGLELTRVCICCCLTASQDQHSQLEVVQTRLAATERALQDANAKASDLNSRLALAETEARLKAQDLMGRVQAAQDAEKLAQVRGRERPPPQCPTCILIFRVI